MGIGSVWAVSDTTTSRSTVLSLSAELLGSLVLCRSVKQRRSRTKLTPPHIPECSVSTKTPHSPFLIVPRFTPGVLLIQTLAKVSFNHSNGRTHS